MTRVTGTLYEEHYTCLIIFRSVLLKMTNVSAKCYRDNQNIGFI